MAGLPEGWDMDYDGNLQRWFYRYKPTGLTQYTFPKPGDEFPEFIYDDGRVDLPPEEKLLSQKQVKRKSTLGNSSNSKQRDRASSTTVSEPDDGQFWFQPDGLMYMGTGAYTDISPLQEEEEERGLGISSPDIKTPATGTPATAPAAPVQGTPEQTSEQAARSHVSPLASVQSTPHPSSAHPATTTPELDSAVVTIPEEPPAQEVVAPPPAEIHMLDSREIQPDPVGRVAELMSESTARCHEEINPAPVELPTFDMMRDEPLPPATYVNAFDLPPVELPLNEVPAGRADKKPVVDKQPKKELEEKQKKEYEAMQQLLNHPFKSTQQGLSQSASAPSTAPAPAPAPAPPAPPPAPPSQPASGKYQPYNPAVQAVQAAHGAVARTAKSANDHKRHSMAAAPPSHFRPQNIPAALQAPQAPPKKPVLYSSASFGPSTTATSSATRPVSIAGPPVSTGGGGRGLSHIPSVLQPARGRPVIRAQTPPQSQSQSQSASPARTYQAYKPSRDLHQDIEETMQFLAKTSPGQTTAVPSETTGSGRPQPFRTNTLPGQFPSLPYMGVRPQMPASAGSDPVTLASLRSHQASSGESTPTGVASSGATVSQAAFTAPLPPSSPDVPPPLNIARNKSPPSKNDLPTASSAFRTSLAAQPSVVPHGDASRTPSPMILSGPVLDRTPSVETTSGPVQAPSELSADAIPSAPVASSSNVQDSGSRKPSVESSQPAAQPQQAPTASIVMSEPLIVAAAPAPAQLSTTDSHAMVTQSPVTSPPVVESAPSLPPVAANNAPVHHELDSSPGSGAPASEPKDQPVAANPVPETPSSEPPQPAASTIVAVDSGFVIASEAQASPQVIAEVQPVQAKQQPEPEPSIIAVHSGFVTASNAQSSSPVVSEVQSVQVQQPSASESGPIVSTIEVEQVPATEALKFAASCVLAALELQPAPNNSPDEVTVQRVVTPPPPVQRLRTPSPVSRAPTPQVQQVKTAQNNQPPISSPAPATASPKAEPVPAGQQIMAASLQPVNVITMATSMPDSVSPLPSRQPSVTSPSTVASQPLAASTASAATPTQQTTTVPVVQQTPPGNQSTRVPVAQNSPAPSQVAGLSNQQQPSPPTPVSQLSRLPTQSSSTAQSPPVPQSQAVPVQPGPVLQPSGNSQQQQSTGQPNPPSAGVEQAQVPAHLANQSRPATTPPVQNHPQSMPARRFSEQVKPQTISNAPTGAPGVAGGPQMPGMFMQPVMHPGMPLQQYIMLPGQPGVFAPGMAPQPGMQFQPVPPHMVQGGQMYGGHYVMQQRQQSVQTQTQPQPQPQSAPSPPAKEKEEKRWFGKLWRSESLRKLSPKSENKLQKANNPRPESPVQQLQQQQQQPPQFYPARPVPHPQFAPPGAAQVPQGAMMMQPVQQMRPFAMQPQPQQQQQAMPPQQQGGPGPQPQVLQQQQQQPQPNPLVWMTPTGQPVPATQAPKFHAPGNSNQPVMPPPHVRQEIRQQEMRLTDQQGQGTQAAPGSAGSGQSQPQGPPQGHGRGQSQGNGAPQSPVQAQSGKGQGQPQQQQQQQQPQKQEQQRPLPSQTKAPTQPQASNIPTHPVKAGIIANPPPSSASGPAAVQPAPAPAATTTTTAAANTTTKPAMMTSAYDGSGWGDESDDDFS
ncbi:hypothetical protein VTJ49DRAFT_7053 [Mycothermus thermophilus]|uniref:WW domain-containing protein n=1 Tax=Humicola insolens TaxID=85995 RepID=A0ABR3VIC8_HUMIN